MTTATPIRQPKGQPTGGQFATLLYTDINMPGVMDGCDLAHAVRARWPETRIIVCSGCDPLEAATLPEAAHFISKPCAERVVRKALQALRLH